MSVEHIADGAYGHLQYDNGELQNDAKQTQDPTSDPVAYVVGSRYQSIGMFRSDHITPGGTRETLIVDLHKRDERFRQDMAYWTAGERTLHMRAPGQRSADTLLRTERSDGVQYHVKLYDAYGNVIVGGGGGAVPSFLRSPNGRYEMEMQDDGNVVVYDEYNDHTPVSAFRLGFGVGV
jgi:hypothetical protein